MSSDWLSGKEVGVRRKRGAGAGFNSATLCALVKVLCTLCNRNVLLSRHSFIHSDIAFPENTSHGRSAGMGTKILEGAEICSSFTF